MAKKSTHIFLIILSVNFNKIHALYLQDNRKKSCAYLMEMSKKQNMHVFMEGGGGEVFEDGRSNY